jgi:hypothetical protein
MFLAPSIFGLFKWRQFEPDVILLAVGWYLRFSLSYRDVRELLAERGVRAVDFQFHTKLSSDTVQLRNCKKWAKTDLSALRLPDASIPNAAGTRKAVYIRRVSDPILGELILLAQPNPFQPALVVTEAVCSSIWRNSMPVRA